MAAQWQGRKKGMLLVFLQKMPLTLCITQIKLNGE